MSVARPIAESGQPEQDLVARIRAGDQRAFETLFKAHYLALRAFVESYVDPATSEEVIQELFLALWRKREAWKPAGGVRAYLFAGARNQALNVIRKRRIASRITEQCIREELLPGSGQVERTPAQQLTTREVETACRQAIRELPESNRLVMMLRWDYGMSHAEIAFVLDTSIKGIEAELTRGLKTLETQLSWLRV